MSRLDTPHTIEYMFNTVFSTTGATEQEHSALAREVRAHILNLPAPWKGGAIATLHIWQHGVRVTYYPATATVDEITAAIKKGIDYAVNQPRDRKFFPLRSTLEKVKLQITSQTPKPSTIATITVTFNTDLYAWPVNDEENTKHVEKIAREIVEVMDGVRGYRISPDCVQVKVDTTRTPADKAQDLIFGVLHPHASSVAFPDEYQYFPFGANEEDENPIDVEFTWTITRSAE